MEAGPESRRRCCTLARAGLAAWWLLTFFAAPVFARAQTAGTQALSVPLILPAGLVFDAGGDLIFAESGSHVVRQVTPGGALTLIAGTGVQGFSGDGGPAAAAELDSPAAVALDAAGNLFIADTHNHRIRRVDAATGLITTFAGSGLAGSGTNGSLAQVASLDLPVALAVDPAGNVFYADARAHLVRRIDSKTGMITTVAGDGVQGFSGDGASALSAELDSPYGLAIDPAGNLYIADTHNQRIRRVNAATGIISTVAGTGVAGFGGDAAAAAAAHLALPRGLVVDSSGNLFLVDSANQRIRRIDAATGQISTIAGVSVQGFAGDGGPATTAEINAPRAIALSAAGLPTLADTGNGRLRQVDAAGVIHTYAGLGALAGETLTLSAPSVVRYGSGILSATLGASPATGAVTLFSDAGATQQPLATSALSANAANFSTAALAAGGYRLEATYAGDATHPPAASGVITLSVAPAPVQATPDAVALLYGQPVPSLTGSLAGVLPQDARNVTLNLSSAVAALSSPGAYPINATLTGTAAGNYTLSTAPAAVTIAQAPAAASLSAGTAAVTAHVASTTTGTPGGVVTLLDGANLSSSTTLSPAGDATFLTGGLGSGSHTLRATYQGDMNFQPATSAPVLITITAPSAVDFTLAATGQTSLTVPSGSATQFTFAVTPVNGALSSPIELAASGLPRGAVASFSPQLLPPSSGAASFVMAVQTPRAALEQMPGPLWALLLPLGLIARLRRRRMAGVLSLVLLATGCGNRVYIAPAGAGVSYNITVTGTATGANGVVLVHSVNVVLTVD